MESYLNKSLINARPIEEREFISSSKAGIQESNIEKGSYLIELKELQTYIYKNGKEETFIHWMNKASFESNFRKIQGLTFGLAVEEMIKGNRVNRVSWNSRIINITLVPGHPSGIVSRKNDEILQNLTDENNFIRPYFKIYTNLDDISIWCPNASDVLADDWQIV